MTEENQTAAAPAITGNQWVVFGPDWGRHPSVSQHLFSQFLGGDPVLWVETVGLRAPRFTWQDMHRSFQKLWDFCTGRRELQTAVIPGLTILSPTTLPFTQFRLVRRFNLWQVRKSVSRMTRRLGYRHPCLVVTVPSQCDYVGSLGEAVSIYYCIDDYALWTGMNLPHVRKLETELLDRVDAVVVPSQGLQQRLAPSGRPVHVLSHGVDVGHFQAACLRTSTPAASFEMVYFGLVDERLDLGILQSIAAALPRARIRLMGPVYISTEPLKAFPNIFLEGPVEYQDLPSAAAAADLFILPFNQGDLAMSCSPIKIKEYLACGRPVVATALPAIQPFSGGVYVTDDGARFVELVVAAAEKRLPFDAEKVASFIAQESWQSKALQFADFVKQTLSDKRRAS